jgi:predicted lipoprotein with Yx(FWY)xxD motif
VEKIMRHPRTIIAAAVVALGGAGVGAAVAASGSTMPASSASAASAVTPVMENMASAPTVHTVSATVNGKVETVLVNGKGLPLYIYKPETTTKSLVSGGLLSLWPADLSSSSSIQGANAKVSVVHDSHGDQVAYNGHLLYTFVSDTAGHVTGQGVSDFFVATPGLAAPTAGSSSSTTPPPVKSSGGGYSY